MHSQEQMKMTLRFCNKHQNKIVVDKKEPTIYKMKLSRHDEFFRYKEDRRQKKTRAPRDYSPITAAKKGIKPLRRNDGEKTAKMR